MSAHTGWSAGRELSKVDGSSSKTIGSEEHGSQLGGARQPNVHDSAETLRTLPQERSRCNDISARWVGLRLGDGNVLGIVDGPHSTYPRTWSRSASNLGSEVDADSLARQLQSRWPPSEYRVHIQVVGGRDERGISVRVWNSAGIKESAVVYPADHAGSADPTTSASLEEVECIIKRLKSEGRL